MEEKQEELEIYQEEEEQDLPKKYSEAECLQMNFKEIKKVSRCNINICFDKKFQFSVKCRKMYVNP